MFTQTYRMNSTCFIFFKAFAATRHTGVMPAEVGPSLKCNTFQRQKMRYTLETLFLYLSLSGY